MLRSALALVPWGRTSQRLEQLDVIQFHSYQICSRKKQASPTGFTGVESKGKPSRGQVFNDAVDKLVKVHYEVMFSFHLNLYNAVYSQGRCGFWQLYIFIPCPTLWHEPKISPPFPTPSLHTFCSNNMASEIWSPDQTSLCQMETIFHHIVSDNLVKTVEEPKRLRQKQFKLQQQRPFSQREAPN